MDCLSSGLFNSQKVPILFRFPLYGFGMTTSTGISWIQMPKHDIENRIGYYHEIIIGRKFNSWFSLQVSPVYVHQNYVDSVSHNDTWALGIGGRIKLSRRIAFVADYHPILSGREPGTTDPLSLGIDIETGGHVFQLHFSNSQGMNERAFITETTNSWGKGEVRFGFNLSRVFNVGKKKSRINDSSLRILLLLVNKARNIG